jgi:hypothetical protein
MTFRTNGNRESWRVTPRDRTSPYRQGQQAANRPLTALFVLFCVLVVLLGMWLA